ncbi:MAG: N-acetyltransferase [Balneola sp.]|nr:MAG: N-acetyltransferase [Balneola sp.]
MDLIIRQEEPADYTAVFELIEQAFATEELSDHQEQFLVERLRHSAAFIPELSLVAEIGSTIVGHILLTRIFIKSTQRTYKSLALAPVSVLPEYQRKGIGGSLIQYAHSGAKELGYQSVILLGHENYYPRFGYQQAHTFGIVLPFEAPKENCMAIPLTENGLKGVSGTVVYPKEFMV